jgi:hypothetical protein
MVIDRIFAAAAKAAWQEISRLPRGFGPGIAVASANFAGWSSVLTHGSTTFVVFAFALSVAPTFTKHS